MQPTPLFINNSRISSSPQKETLCTLQLLALICLLQPLATITLHSVYRYFSLNISHKWNYTICSLRFTHVVACINTSCFSFANNILLNKFYPFIPQTLELFPHLGLLWIMLLKIFIYRFLCRHIFLLFLGICLGELLAYVECCIDTFYNMDEPWKHDTK